MKNNRKNFLITFMLLLLLAIGIGYAYLTSSLSINGIAEISANKWDIHFDNVQVDSGSVAATTPASIDTNDDTLVNFAVKLDKPGDYYLFTVDVVNEGTIDGMVESITSKINNTPISNLPNFLEYSITYEDDDEIESNHLLKSGDTETYKVRIAFKDDIDKDDLLASSTTYTFSFDASYIQSDSNAVERENGIYLYANNYVELDTNTGDIIGSPVKIGDNVSKLGTTYEDYLDAQTNFGYDYFFKYKVLNGIITETNLAYILNNNLYVLKGAGGVLLDEQNNEWDFTNVPYLENKNILLNSFGANNCTEEQVTNYNYIYNYTRCTSSDFSVEVQSDGDVNIMNNNGWRCEIGVNSVSACIEFVNGN